ncbi:MAG: ral stress protein [Nocardia sp.]|uniref:TerD family protein n=1 Tax=Nocardia sp. TaxID=1821 RepID=UPI00261A5497|nr:TerD family protein [Nocardia sp.]MCU1646643.1 ral stress protein [Nocardia sp.]
MSAALVKGQNGPLNVNDVVISVQIAAPADLSALLVTEHGKVRSDADFVFFNQPNGPGVKLQPGASGQPAALEISLAAVPADIEQIRAVITLDEAGNNFGRIAPPVARVADLGGNTLFEYRVEGLQAESIVIALEVYRRQGSWKVRAVGQGYAGGFGALVTDHGVQVSESQSAAPAAAPVPQYAPAPGYPPPPPNQQFASAGGYPPPAPAEFSPAVGYPSADPNEGYSAPGSYPPQGSGYPPPPQGHPQQGFPPPPGYGPGQGPGQAAESADRDLPHNHTVSLVKGQRINLRKEGGAALTYVKMGLGWDPVKRGGMFGNRAPDVDLDASVVMFADMSPVDVVYYGSLASKDGSVRHQGDNLTGEGDGDDEVILVDLTRLPAHVTTLVFIVTSYKGHTFEQLANAFCRLVDGTNNAELARFTLPGGANFTGMAMAKVYRPSGSQDWKLQAIGEGFQAKHPGEAVPQLGRFLKI